MADVTILVRKNGPYRIEGPAGSFRVVTPEGRELVVNKERVSLCRCGHSSTKPICDGTHRTAGFTHDPDEVEEETGEYVAVASVHDIGEGQIKGVRVNDQPVVLGKLGGQIYAIGGVCTHEEALLEEGDLEGEVILCPLHNSGFNLKTGKATQLPATAAVPTYRVKVEGTRILVSAKPR